MTDPCTTNTTSLVKWAEQHEHLHPPSPHHLLQKHLQSHNDQIHLSAVRQLYSCRLGAASESGENSRENDWDFSSLHHGQTLSDKSETPHTATPWTVLPAEQPRPAIASTLIRLRVNATKFHSMCIQQQNLSVSPSILMGR